MSKESDIFVTNLKAAFPYMSREALVLYQTKLKNWNLTKQQWVSALDNLIGMETDGNPPQLSTIFAELHRQIGNASSAPDKGWAYFRLHEREYAIRIERNGGNWLISDMLYTDHGQTKHAQPNYGLPLLDHIPAQAYDFRLIPDKVYIPPEELIKPEEIREIIDNTL